MTKQRRQHGEGTIFKRKVDGVWIGAIEIAGADGKRRRKTVSSKRRDIVVRRLRELRQDFESGRLATAPSTTVATYLDHWLNTVRGPHIRPKTFAWYSQSIRCHIVPQIGTQRLNRLTPEHVRAMVRAVQDQHSTASAQQAHTTLRTALRDALDEGIVTHNVAAIVRKPKHTAKVRREFTFEQAHHIYSTALTLADHVWAARVMTAFMTGARPGELLGLRWRYVDLDAGEIELTWQLQQLPMEHGCGGTCGKVRPGFCTTPKFKVPPGFSHELCYRSLAFTPVKTKAGNRVVPLLTPIHELFRQLYINDSNNPYDLVFHHHDGRPYSPKEDYTAWKSLLQQSGLPPDAVGYQSRHTAATLMRRFGVDEGLRMAIMGHSSVIAHHGYLHADQAEKRRALNNLGRLALPGEVSGDMIDRNQGQIH